MATKWEPMRLLLTITGLREGYAIDFSAEDAINMARMDCRSLLFDRPDVPALIAKLRDSHGLQITEKLEGGYRAYRRRR